MAAAAFIDDPVNVKMPFGYTSKLVSLIPSELPAELRFTALGYKGHGDRAPYQSICFSSQDQIEPKPSIDSQPHLHLKDGTVYRQVRPHKLVTDTLA